MNKWPLYIHAVPAPCSHEWVDITTVFTADLQFMCVHCGAIKHQARRGEPTQP